MDCNTPLMSFPQGHEQEEDPLPTSCPLYWWHPPGGPRHVYYPTGTDAMLTHTQQHSWVINRDMDKDCVGKHNTYHLEEITTNICPLTHNKYKSPKNLWSYSATDTLTFPSVGSWLQPTIKFPKMHLHLNGSQADGLEAIQQASQVTLLLGPSDNELRYSSQQLLCSSFRVFGRRQFHKIVD